MSNSKVKKNMIDCETSEDFKLHFEEYNDLQPNVYCQVALKKLKDLTQEQINDLNNFIEYGSVKGRTGWSAYCYILTKQQIEFVGW